MIQQHKTYLMYIIIIKSRVQFIFELCLKIVLSSIILLEMNNFLYQNTTQIINP